MGGQGTLVWEPLREGCPFYPSLQPLRLASAAAGPSIVQGLQAIHPMSTLPSKPGKPPSLLELTLGFLLAVAN